MNNPPIGVPARAPKDMNANIIPIRAPTRSMGDICATQDCQDGQRSIVSLQGTYREEREERARGESIQGGKGHQTAFGGRGIPDREYKDGGDE